MNQLFDLILRVEPTIHSTAIECIEEIKKKSEIKYK